MDMIDKAFMLALLLVLTFYIIWKIKILGGM